MAPARSTTRRDEPAGIGSIAFLIVYSVLLVIVTSALWISYLT
jgi:hypothetical protein